MSSTSSLPRAARASQLLIVATLLSTGFSEPVTQPTHEDLRESINSPMPYGFKYEAYGEDGGGHTREESADGSGRVVGSYSIFTREGLLRRVFYEADHNGFRAHVETNEPGTKTSNPADVTIVSTASEGGGIGGGGTADAPLPNAATTRPVKTTSPAAGGTTNQTPGTTTDLPPGYVLPDRYRPNESRRPPGSELLTSRILTLDKPVDGNKVYPGRPGFESDTDVPSPPAGIHAGLPPSGIVPVGPVQVTRVPGRPAGFPVSRPRSHVNYVPSKDKFGPSRPSHDGSFRIPAGSSGGIFSPSQLAPKGNVGGPQALDQTGHGDGDSFSVDSGSGIPGPGSKTAFSGSPAAPRGQGVGTQSFGPQKYGPEDTGVFRADSGVGQGRPQYQPPGLGAPLFTRITQGSTKFPGRVDYGSQPGFPGVVQPGFPGAPGFPGGAPGGTRQSFGSRGPFGGTGFGPGSSPAGAPLDQFGGTRPTGNRYDIPGQPLFPGTLVGRQGSPQRAQDDTGAAIDGGDSSDSSNEDGFAPNDPRRPFLFRNEDQRPSAPVSPSGRGGPGQQPGTYAIRADNGKIESVSFQPGTQQFQGTGPDRRFEGNRGSVPLGPFRRPAFGGTRRGDPFRPYKPRPIESGHPEPVFVPQGLTGPGSRTTPFDTVDPQRIDGSGFPQPPSGFGGQRPGGFSTGRPYRDRFPSGGPYPPIGQQDRFDRRPQQPLTPYTPGTPVPPVPAIANVGSVPNPRNHFANRVFDRTPADTFGRPVGQPPIHAPSLIGMEIIRYGPDGPQVHRFNGSAGPGSLAPPENLEFRGPFQPSRAPGSVQRTPLSANRLVPRPPLPVRGNVNRVLYSEAPQQPTFPRRLGEPKGPEEDFGGAFEGLIRDERPDLLELRRKQKPSGAVSGKAGEGLDFLEELLPFYEKDLDINKKGNEAGGGDDRKPVVHEPILPEHRDLLCDDDDPRFSDPRKPGCVKKLQPLGGDAGGATEPDGKNNEAPIDADEEFLNYRNPFSGVLPSPGAPEKVDRDGKTFQRPFLDKDGKVIPVLIDRNQPNPSTLEGTVQVTRNKLSPGADEAGVPGRPPTPDLGAERPIEGRRAFGNNGVFQKNFGALPGPGLAQGFGGPSAGKTFPSAVPPPQDGNLLTFQNIPRSGANDLGGFQDPLRRNFQPFGQPAFAPPHQTIRFGQRLSGVRNQNPLVPSQRPHRTQARVQPQTQSHVVFPPPPLHRKAVLSPPDGPESPASGFGDPLSFTSPQNQGASRLGHPAGGFGQPGQQDDAAAGAFGNVGASPPRFAFVDSRRLRQEAVKTPVQSLTTGREDGALDFQGQLVAQGPDALAPGSLTPTSPASKVRFSDENIAPPATFTFFDTKKPTLVPNRPPLNVVRRKTLKSPSDLTGKSGQVQLAPQEPGSTQGPEPGKLQRKPLLAGNGEISDDLDGRGPIGVLGPFNFVDSRKPLEIARQRVAQRRPQGFDSVRQPGVQPLRPGTVTVTRAPFDGNLDSGPQGGFAGAAEELRRQRLPQNGPSGSINGAVELPAVLIPQTGPLRQPVQPVLLSVQRVPVRGPAVAGDAIVDQDPRNIQAFDQGSRAKGDKGISGQELLRRGVNSAGSAEEGDREEDGESQRVNPYSFGYSSYDGLGGHVTRHESKDDTGRVTGYYVVEDVDGRKRTVHYVADKDGFRATVHTNEQGTDNLDPANVQMRVENRMPHPPPTPRVPSQGSLVKTSPSPALGGGVGVPVLDTVDQSVKKS